MLKLLGLLLLLSSLAQAGDMSQSVAGLSATAPISSGLVDLSTVVTALGGKLSTIAPVSSGLVDLSTVALALASLTPTTLRFGANGVSFSSAPIGHVSGSSIVGTLASGTTFMVFTPDSPITIRRINLDVVVAGVSGTGDTVFCGATGTSFVNAVLSAAAAAGTTATGSGSVPVAYQTPVFCNISSGAATRPILNVTVEYVNQ